MERKNPVGRVPAFARAFEPGEGPVLVLKSINGHIRLNDIERLRAAVETAGRKLSISIAPEEERPRRVVRLLRVAAPI
jgi:hypothetical protein